MNGQGTITFQNGDQYTGGFNNGAFNGQGTFQSKEGWTYEGDFVNGQAEGKGKLTTEQEVIYEGTFKQGVFSTKIIPPYQRRYYYNFKVSAYLQNLFFPSLSSNQVCEIKIFEIKFHKL